MREPLEAMGIHDLFVSQLADLSAMTESEQSLYVGSLTQEARLMWDEQGVEAAAYTEVEMLRSSNPSQSENPVEFKLDRPFLFVLRNRQDILFIGTCYQPN